MFNLGIGLVDSLCDEDAATGEALLALVQGQDLAAASEAHRGRGWLRAEVPPALAEDPGGGISRSRSSRLLRDLHDSYPDDEWLTLRRTCRSSSGAARSCGARRLERETSGVCISGNPLE
jgi:hypothetical protein